LFSLDLKTATELLLRTVFGSKFQTAGAEHSKSAFCKCWIGQCELSINPNP